MDEKDTLYARWLNGELSSAELEQLKASGELEELQAIIDATEQASLPAYNLDAAFKQFKQHHPSPASKTKVRSINWRYAIGAAASLALLITAFFLLRKNPAAQIQAEYANILMHTFSEGTTTLVNDGSSMTYDVEAWENVRRLNLKGEAFFSVTKGKPFIVNTSNGSVEVLGTKFNVRAWGNVLHVECYEGSVSVKSNGADTILKEKQSVLVKNGKMEALRAITHQNPLWMTGTGTSMFFEEDVQEVFAELERQYNIEVKYNAPSKSFSGNFSHDSLEVALNNICKPLGLNYTLSNDNKTVSITTEN